MPRYKERKPFSFLPGLLVWIGISVGLPVTFVGAHAPSLHEWLWSFQTLIGGVLAVGAAYFTIQKMSEIDKAQADRHNELVALQLRSDSLLLRRIMGSAVLQLSYEADRLDSQARTTLGDIERLAPHGDPILSDNERGTVAEIVRRRCGVMKTIVERIREKLHSLDDDRIRALMGPRTLLLHSELIELKSRLAMLPLLDDGAGALIEFHKKQDWFHGDAVEVAAVFREYTIHVADFSDVAAKFKRVFGALARRYPEPLGIAVEDEE